MNYIHASIRIKKVLDNLVKFTKEQHVEILRVTSYNMAIQLAFMQDISQEHLDMDIETLNRIKNTLDRLELSNSDQPLVVQQLELWRRDVLEIIDIIQSDNVNLDQGNIWQTLAILRIYNKELERINNPVKAEIIQNRIKLLEPIQEVYELIPPDKRERFDIAISLLIDGILMEKA